MKYLISIIFLMLTLTTWASKYSISRRHAPTSTVVVATNIPQFENTVAWYRHAGTSVYWEDSSYLGTNIYARAAATNTPIYGGAGTGFFYRGSDHGVCINTNLNASLFTSMTISAWLQLSQSVDSAGIFGQRYLAITRMDGLVHGSIAPYPFQFRFSPRTTNYPTTIVQTGVWFNVIGVLDGPNSATRIYSNGVRVGVAGAYGSFITNFVYWYLGFDNAVGARRYRGCIDDLTVWNTALTDSEALQTYQFGHGTSYEIPRFESLVYWYPFPFNIYKYQEYGYKGTNVLQDSGGGAVGTYVSPDEGLFFDGGDGAFTTTIQYNNATAMTWLAWVKVSNTVAHAGIVHNHRTSGNYEDGIVIHDTSNRFVGMYKDSQVVAASEYSTGVWYHVATSWDADSDTMDIYIDGALSQTRATPIGSVTNITTRIGFGYNGVTVWRFNGNIDNVMIYTQRLDGAEILDIKNRGRKR